MSSIAILLIINKLLFFFNFLIKPFENLINFHSIILSHFKSMKNFNYNSLKIN
jgi:hypothetical protein